jgi:hypothetical protein
MGIFLGSTPASVYYNGTAAAVAGVYLGALQVFPTGATVPGAPTGLVGEDFFNIAWTPPADDGGSPITGYRVYVDGVDRTDDTESGSEFLTATSWRWAPGGEYTFEVSAVNAVGEGPKSDPLAYGFA